MLHLDAQFVLLILHIEPVSAYDHRPGASHFMRGCGQIYSYRTFNNRRRDHFQRYCLHKFIFAYFHHV